MGSLPAEDRKITEGTPWEVGGQPEPTPNKVRATSVTGGVISVISDEFNKFSTWVKACIRWFALLVGISFGLNYGSEQIRRTVCHWFPHSTYFCENPTTRSPSTEIDFPATEGGWILSTDMLNLVAILIVLLLIFFVALIISENKGAKKKSNVFIGFVISIMMILFVASILILGKSVPSWF